MKVSVALLGVCLFLGACGPATFTRTRSAYEPVTPADARQEKEGIVVELKFAQRADLPPSFVATVQACSNVGALMVDGVGRPVTQQVRLARPGQYWEQVAITNNTAHVVRMTEVVIRLFDPSGGQFEPINWGDMQTELMGARPCPSTAVALNQFRVNKVFDRNMEIVPRSTSTFWVPFRPASMEMAGVWRFSVYDVPVAVDQAGRATRKAQFDMRVAAKKFIDTYSQNSPLEPPRRVSSREVGDSGVAQSPAPSPTPAAPARAPTEMPRPAAGAPPPPYTPPFAPPTVASPAPATGAPSATSPALARETVLKAQARLNALGFSVGTPDGSIGPRSKAAIARYQASKRLPATGDLDAETLSALGVDRGPAPAQAPIAPAASPVKNSTI